MKLRLRMLPLVLAFMAVAQFQWRSFYPHSSTVMVGWAAGIMLVWLIKIEDQP